MPGGSVQVAPPDAGAGDSLTSAWRSKDVWVLSDRPVATVTLLRPHVAAVSSRSGNDLPSRVADNLYWLGRFVERAEGICVTCGLRAAMTSELEPSDLPALGPVGSRACGR